MNNVMIDLETLAFDYDAVFPTIGACLFEPTTGEIGETFYRVIDWQSALDFGRTVDQKVLKWWMAQEPEAKAEILKDGDTIEQVLFDFGQWLPDDAIVWGNGPTFDIAKLETAYTKYLGIDMIPWEFHAIRCCRTIRDLCDPMITPQSIPFTGIKHHALHDAIHQAKYVSAMWQWLRPTQGKNNG